MGNVIGLDRLIGPYKPKRKPAMKYKDWAPSQHDRKGAFLPDRQEWIVVPVIRTRDSGPLELSNFDAALKILGGERKCIEVHNFNHWGPGWIEIIIVHPWLQGRVDAIADRLENYPPLDEEDFSRREWEDYVQGWSDYGAKDFARALQKEFEFSDAIRYRIEESPDLCEFYESLRTNGEYYTGESSGVYIRTQNAADDCTREQLAAFLRKLRSTKVQEKVR